jgi:polyhydroxybutyrate depolymerase
MKKKKVIAFGIVILIILFLGIVKNIKKNNVQLKDNFSQYSSKDSEFSLKHGGLMRKYKIHIPKSYDGKTTPLVIYIHGGGGDMRAAYMDGIDKMSEKYGFILAIPEGTGEIKTGHMRATWNGGKWETGECCGDADDVGFISEMIKEIKNNLNINDKMIYATGISNGGLMVNRLGCELADKIAAIATVAPAGLELNCNPSRPISVMDIHGTADPANPPDGSNSRGIFSSESKSGFSKDYKRMTPYQVIDKWKKINKCSENKKQGYKHDKANCIVYNECSKGSEIELCIVKDMGHTYPSGLQYLPKSMVGPVSYDISFDQIWTFFQRHPIME